MEPALDTSELKELMSDTSIYIYKSMDGVIISCDDVVRGTHTNVLQEHIDWSPTRTHPFIGEQLKGHRLTENGSDVIGLKTSWTVYHVEVFKPEVPGILREVVIAWCKQL